MTIIFIKHRSWWTYFENKFLYQKCWDTHCVFMRICVCVCVCVSESLDKSKCVVCLKYRRKKFVDCFKWNSYHFKNTQRKLCICSLNSQWSININGKELGLHFHYNWSIVLRAFQHTSVRNQENAPSAKSKHIQLPKKWPLIKLPPPHNPIEATNEEPGFSQHVPLFTSFDS